MTSNRLFSFLLRLPLLGLAGFSSLFAQEFTLSAKTQQFFDNHCTECHGPKKAKGSIRLDHLDGRIAEGLDFETWSEIYDQLAQREMPPEESKHQPDDEQRAWIISWLGKELEKARSSPRGRHLLGQFSFGNRVDHDALFSGEIKKLPFSPPRLWRMNPNIYDRTKKRIFKDHWMELRRARQPFSLEQRPGINDYSEGLFADSATLETLLRNARGIVEHQLDRDIPEIFRRILESDRAPTQEQAEAAVRFQFETLVLRPPKTKELARYRDYFLRSIKESGGDIRASLEVCLKAIALNPEAIYRMELGLGDKDDHGRTILSDNELAFAISFALTDDPPDKILWSAARSRNLDSPRKIRAQLERILRDPVIAKPKLLRFFREFFGYHRAPQVFKDAKRFKNYDWGIVANQLVHEADLLVLHALKQDRDVLRQLITTEKYFVGHIGLEADPKDLEQRLIALRCLYDYWKGKPWQKLEYELETGVRTEIERLHPYFQIQPMKHRMSGGLIKDYMPYLTICYENGLRPMLAQFVLMEGERERNLTSAHDQRFFLGAYNLSIDQFDCPIEQPFELNKEQRVGLLTHPSWLIAHSKNTDTNPVTRGKWIRERLLAGHVPDVPITVDAVVPEDPHKTLRERFQKTEQQECWRCHKKMNPLGMTFEAYDDFGRFRTTDKISGKPIDSSGQLDSTGVQSLDGKVENAVELMKRLGQSDRVRQSFIRHAFRYWMGRNEMLSDSATLIAADEAYVKSGGSFRAMLISLLSSDSFIFRKGGETK